MSDFMPAYVYSNQSTWAEIKPQPEGTVECDGCRGDGVFYGSGSVVNGHFVGFTGKCYRCGTKGWQTPKDVKRNEYYDNHVRRYNVG